MKTEPLSAGVLNERRAAIEPTRQLHPSLTKKMSSWLLRALLSAAPGSIQLTRLLPAATRSAIAIEMEDTQLRNGGQAIP